MELSDFLIAAFITAVSIGLNFMWTKSNKPRTHYAEASVQTENSNNCSEASSQTVWWPKKMEDYIMEAILSKTRTSTVHKAVCKVSHEICVLKVLPLATGNHPHQMPKLVHENIVKYHTTFVENGQLVLVMGYYENTVQDVIDGKKKKVKAAEAELLLSEFMKQALRGLSYMHERGIFHGNVKPSNLLIKLSKGVGSVQLCDFGVPALLNGHASSKEGDIASLGWLGVELALGGKTLQKPWKEQLGQLKLSKEFVDVLDKCFSDKSILAKQLLNEPFFKGT